MADEINDVEAGTIQSIKLRNFMCHSNLVVNFNHGLNVITGSNGSGKSAILTAIIFVLGGKLSSTDRASKHSEFIKKKSLTASVSITLHNSGPEAYKNEEYGDNIIIERNITRDGMTKYHIRSVSGSQISSKREEVTAITDHFNIQIDNPINILTQEKTKSFLNSNDPKSKYKLFMAATNLHQVLQDYDDCQQVQVEINDKLAIKKDSLEKQQFHLEDLQSKIRMASEIEQIDSKLEDLRHKLTCREIKRIEEEKDKLVRSRNKDQLILQNFEEKDSRIKFDIEEEETVFQNLNEKIKALEQEIDDKTNEKRKCQEKIAKGLENIQRKTVSENSTRSELKNSQSAYESLNRKFKEMIKTGKDNLETQQLTLQENIKRRNGDIQTMEEQMHEIKNKIRQLEDDFRRIRSERESLNKNKNTTLNDIDEKNRKITFLKKNTHERLNVFGSFTSELVKKISDANERGLFRRCPIGPIGYLLQISDPKWSLAVEICLKNLVRAYIVFTYQDKVLLQNFLNKCCRPEEYPTIIITSYSDRLYDFSRQRPRCNHVSMVDVIRCSDVNVINVLIDQCGVEKILCFTEVREARTVMNPHPPENVQRAFTVEGDELLSFRGGSRLYGSKQKEARFLGKDLTSIIENLQEDCRKCAERLAEIHKQILDINSNASQIEKNISQLRDKESSFRSKINQNRSEIIQLESQLEVLNEKSSSSIEQELQIIRNKNKELEDQLQTIHNELQESKLSNQELQKQYEDIKIQTPAIKNNWNELKKLKNDKFDNIQYLKNSRSSQMKNMEKAKKQILTYEASISKLEKSILDKMSKFEGTDRVMIDVEESVDYLILEIKKLEKAVDTQKMSIEDLNILKRDFEVHMKSYQQNAEHISDLTTVNNKLKSMLNSRSIIFQKLRNLIVRRTQITFEELLKNRGYKGNLLFDHEKSCLDIKVNTSDAQQTSNDTRGLSGGERSFSTLSFVVSLWQCIDCPFRCLDEFDVFMDVIHRKTGLRLLKDFSTSTSNQQLILITPQNIRDLSSVKDIKVIEMENPR